MPEGPHHNIGIFSGLAAGPLETNFRYLDSLLDDGEGNSSPTLFSHSVHNAMAGYLSRIFKIHGPVSTLTSFTWPFLVALREATIAIAAGVVKYAIVVTAATASPAIDYALDKITEDQRNPLNSGAVCWILEEAVPGLGQQITVDHIFIQEKGCDGRALLLRQGEPSSVASPLLHAFELTDLFEAKLDSGQKGPVVWQSETAFGKATLHGF